MAGGPSLEVPTEEFVAAVVFSPGEELAHDDVGVRDFVEVLGVVKVAAEPAEGVEAETGFDDAPDDAGRVGRLGWNPVGRDGLGDAAELEDGHGDASVGSDLRG